MALKTHIENTALELLKVMVVAPNMQEAIEQAEIQGMTSTKGFVTACFLFSKDFHEAVDELRKE